MGRILTYLIISSVIAFSSCNSHKDEVIITGTIKNAQGKTMILQRQRLDALILSDSFKVKNNESNFKLSTHCLDFPEFFNVIINDKTINLIVDSAMSINISLDYEDIENYTTNSLSCQQIKRVNQLVGRSIYSMKEKAKIISLETPKQEKLIQDDLNQEFTTLQDSLTPYIYNDPRSFVAYYTVFQRMFGDLIFNPLDSKEFRYYAAVATSFQNFRPNNYRTNHLYEFTNRALQERRTAEVTAAIKRLPPSIPEIELPNTDGDTIKLSDYRGQVVILYFWTYLDANSASNNIALKKLYEKYASKGLKIYQVSFDTNIELWKKSIAEQKIPWTNVCDILGNNSSVVRSYNVQKLPLLYLVDKEMNVYRGDSMSEEELSQKIKNLL